MIAAAQFRATPFDISANIARHVTLIQQAAAHGAQIVVFPEMSITAYEPTHADAVRMFVDDHRLHALRNASRDYAITVAAGLVTPGIVKPRISQLTFAPDGQTYLYSKQQLHNDEIAYFEPGTERLTIPFGEHTMAPAICYEALCEPHIAQAATDSLSIYAASVAKNQTGVQAAHEYFPNAARLHTLPIIMSNAVGISDGSKHAGQSAAWNDRGTLLAALDDSCEGLVLYDTKNGTAHAATAAQL